MNYLGDAEFADAFERCELSNESFHHCDHIRLAWIYLQRYGADAAEVRIAATIRKFAAHFGKTDKYHEAVTVAWMRLLADAARSVPSSASFSEAIAAFPKLLDKNYLREFYSDALLDSQIARDAFVAPDRKPLP